MVRVTAAREVVPLQRIRLEVVELDKARPVFRVGGRVRAKQGSSLDVAWDLDRETALEIADELVAVRADAAHRVVVAVKRLLGEDRLARA